MNTPGLVRLILGILVLLQVEPAMCRDIQRAVLGMISAKDFARHQTDRLCRDSQSYRIYLIDNFEQHFYIVPEVKTTHGDMLVRLLKSGRDDLEIRAMNTSLGNGLALVLRELARGACADAVISSVPGSNYTYDQISSLFSHRIRIRAENILAHQADLRQLMRQIAFKGFPSAQWLEQVDVNSVKLKNDARKFVFIEALSRFGIPVLLPYGNPDSRHKGKMKTVNLLSLAPNAMVFSALDLQGNRVPGFPYSPLSSGDEPAFYTVIECPLIQDPFRAALDINRDWHWDYSFQRTGSIPFSDPLGNAGLAPPLLSSQQFKKWLDALAGQDQCLLKRQVVLTAGQYKALRSRCMKTTWPVVHKTYVWIKDPQKPDFFEFDARCRERGLISGTSVIPPNKVRELLPPKTGEARLTRVLKD